MPDPRAWLTPDPPPFPRPVPLPLLGLRDLSGWQVRED
jgi:hypothetical protein